MTTTDDIVAEPPSPTRTKVVLGIEGMVSPRSEPLIEGTLAKLPGVVA